MHALPLPAVPVALAPLALPRAGCLELAKVLSPEPVPSGNFGLQLDLADGGLAALTNGFAPPAAIFEPGTGGSGGWGLAAQLPTTTSTEAISVTLDGDTAVCLETRSPG